MRQLQNITKKAEALNTYLLQMDVIKEYRKYEKLVKGNTELESLEKKIKALQKQIVRKKSKQDETVTATIKEYEEVKASFEGHPLVVNYLYLKDEANMLLQHINTKINGELTSQDLTKY